MKPTHISTADNETLYHLTADGEWYLLSEKFKPTKIEFEMSMVRPLPNDMVNHPPHYQSDNGIECIDAIRAALGKDGFIAYCTGNVIKYLWRDKSDRLEDYKKAAWYLNRAIEEQGK